jgi:hypothetical protein
MRLAKADERSGVRSSEDEWFRGIAPEQLEAFIAALTCAVECRQTGKPLPHDVEALLNTIPEDVLARCAAAQPPSAILQTSDVEQG